MRSIIRVLTSARELWGHYIAILVCSVITAATGLVMPFIIARATDVVVTAQRTHTDQVRQILWLAVALFAADLANTVISNIGGYAGDQMSIRLRAIMSSRYYEKLLTLSQRYFDDQLTGTVISRLTRSITETTQFLNSFANNFFPMLLTVGAVLVISAYYFWPLAVLLVVIFPLFTWLTTLTSKKWQRLEAAKNSHIDIANGRFAEVVQQIRVVKSFVTERRELGLFDRHYEQTIGLTQRQSRYWHGMDATRRGVLNLVFFVIYAIIFVRTAQGHFTVGELVLLVQLVNLARTPVTMMSFLVDASQRAVAGSRDYFAVLAEPSDEALPTTVAPVTPAVAADRPAVEFDHITFGYGDGESVLKDVSFSVGAHERVALVGESGGGKSTLISLLLGFYQPTEGTIRVLGDDVATVGVEQVRERIGVVFQDPALFSGTVRENIAYADPEASDDLVARAAHDAHADTFIKHFADGYDTLIGERGLKLSGGQRQRIAVARTIVKDAPILVLDEATSALDTKSERLVQQGLDRLMAGRTSVIIAHRLSTIAGVDRIVTLKDGRVDEIGTPDELATSGGIYAELLSLQNSGNKRDRKRLQNYDILG